MLVSTDTLAISSMIKAYEFPMLNALVLGEGILNDAVSVVIYTIDQKFL
jgi:NhaP-type Na+/H+ or K+/H+ antiporter